MLEMKTNNEVSNIYIYTILYYDIYNIIKYYIYIYILYTYNYIYVYIYIYIYIYVIIHTMYAIYNNIYMQCMLSI